MPDTPSQDRQVTQDFMAFLGRNNFAPLSDAELDGLRVIVDKALRTAREAAHQAGREEVLVAIKKRRRLCNEIEAIRAKVRGE